MNYSQIGTIELVDVSNLYKSVIGHSQCKLHKNEVSYITSHNARSAVWVIISILWSPLLPFLEIYSFTGKILRQTFFVI